MTERKTKPVIVRVKDENPETRKNAALFVFDEDGLLLEAVSLSDGEARLATPLQAFKRNLALLLGPLFPKEFGRKRISPEMVREKGGIPLLVRPNIRRELIIAQKLPQFILPIFRFCNIKGGLTKNFLVDGQHKALPVCNARVHICEVDRLYLKWPDIPLLVRDDLLDRIRKFIKVRYKIPPVGPGPGPVTRPEPRPIPVPGPVPGPVRDLPLTNKPWNLALHELKNSRWGIPEEIPLPVLPDRVKEGLVSPQNQMVEATLLENFRLMHPILCLWPHYWPFLYTCREIGVVQSGADGKFNFLYLHTDNDLDIYIWVEVLVNGVWETVYRPSLPCHTRWDYVCGTDISISLTDPRVTPCTGGTPLPGEVVWFRSIGEYVTAQHIEQNISSEPLVQGVKFRNAGCSDFHPSPLPATAVAPVSPFGGTLHFKLLFGDGFPNSDITHYRWKRTLIANAALTPVYGKVPEILDNEVAKPYFVITTDAAGDTQIVTRKVILGPLSSGDHVAFRIPDCWDIKADSGIPDDDRPLTIQWTSPDFWSAHIDTNGLEDGLWRFDLEVGTLDKTGVFLRAELPKQVFKVSHQTNPGNSVNAPDIFLRKGNHYLSDVPGTHADRLSLKVRIDNAGCTADIQDAFIRVSPSDVRYSGRCGFIRYDTVVPAQKTTIGFIASHPRNFAFFSFGVVKGNSTDPIAPSINQSGYVHAGTPIYPLAGGLFSREVPVPQLLGDCPQAAFAENLYVWALATDGTTRIYANDDSDTNAFALSNV